MQHFSKFHPQILLSLALALCVSGMALAQDEGSNDFGIREPVTSSLQNKDIRVPNTDQSVDGVVQSLATNQFIENAFSPGVFSMTGNEVNHVASPNADMRAALRAMARAAEARDQAAMEAAAQDLKDILMGTTKGRIYDGFPMLNWNRFKPTEFGVVSDENFPPNLEAGEYKMKTARLTGETFISPFDGEERNIWEVDVNMLYYDGQIDSDTFLLRFPFGHHDDDVLHVNYRIFSLVQEDFSPTLVMLDRRQALNTVQFPFKGFDAVWIAFFPGEVLNVTVKYPPVRMVRGVYTWGWRVHPPRIQFLQPVYEIRNAHTNEIELDPQGASFAFRNREDLTLDNISPMAPEMKMYDVAKAVLLDGASPETIEDWLTKADQGPRGRWFDWANLVTEQRQLPEEVWDLLADEGLNFGEFGDYNMISVFMNNEMYGDGPFQDEIKTWNQSEVFKVKLVNLDKHTHYFRNVDFSDRLHDDILNCCGGGETSFEIMNFKPSYGAPKVAEMQWRAGWGFRPHYDVIQQSHVFPRGVDRANLTPYRGGYDGIHYGYQYTEEFRGGDFRFNPPPFVIGFDANDPSPFLLRDADGENGLVIGQRTEGYGVAKACPQDNYPGFCVDDWAAYNPNGVRNFPPPPLRGKPVFPEDAGKFPGDIYPNEAVELRYPPFLRNPCQDGSDCGDIIPPTGAWRPFLWYNPNNGSLFIDPDDPAKGHWADLTFSHGAPVFGGKSLNATIELPRASGQVFYQFDDLFHDNAIFSPHPVFTGFGGTEEVDEVVHLRAFVKNFVRVRGRLSALPSSGEFAQWVSLYEGPADANGCTGEIVATSPVDRQNGFFVFRFGNRWSSPLIDKATVGSGSTLCVESTVGSFAETVIE